MRIRDNRVLACIVLAAVIVLCPLLSGSSSLKRQKKAAESIFFSASESIYAELFEKADNADVMLKIAGQYDTLDQSLLERTQTAADDLRASMDTRDIARIHSLSDQLTGCVEELYAAGSKLTMQGNDADDFRFKYKNFSAADLRISHDPYNDEAAAVREVFNGFPASLIASLCGVHTPELFQ